MCKFVCKNVDECEDLVFVENIPSHMDVSIRFCGYMISIYAPKLKEKANVWFIGSMM